VPWGVGSLGAQGGAQSWGLGPGMNRGGRRKSECRNSKSETNSKMLESRETEAGVFRVARTSGLLVVASCDDELFPLACETPTSQGPTRSATMQNFEDNGMTKLELGHDSKTRKFVSTGCRKPADSETRATRALPPAYAGSGAPVSRPGKRRFGIHWASEQSAT